MTGRDPFAVHDSKSSVRPSTFVVRLGSKWLGFVGVSRAMIDLNKLCFL